MMLCWLRLLGFLLGCDARLDGYKAGLLLVHCVLVVRRARLCLIDWLLGVRIGIVVGGSYRF